MSRQLALASSARPPAQCEVGRRCVDVGRRRARSRRTQRVLHRAHREVVDRVGVGSGSPPASATRVAQRREQLLPRRAPTPRGTGRPAAAPLIANGRVFAAASGLRACSSTPSTHARTRGAPGSTGAHPALERRRRAGAARRRAPRAAARPCRGSGGRRPGSTARTRATMSLTRGSIVAGAAHHRVGGVDEPADLLGVGVGAVAAGSRAATGPPAHGRHGATAGTTFCITGTVFPDGPRRKHRAARRPVGCGSCRWTSSRPAPTTATGPARYCADGSWTDETLGSILAAGLRRGAASCRPRVRSDVRPWRGTFADGADLARRVAGGLLGARRAARATRWRSSSRTGSRPRRSSGRSRCSARCPVPIVHFYGPKEVGFILRQSGARVLVTADRFGHLDYLANLETLRPHAARARAGVRGRRRGARATRESFDVLRRRRPDRRPGADRPVGAGAHRLHVGHDRRPEGRRALAPHDRLRDPPAAALDADRGRRRCSSARRSATASACSPRCSSRCGGASRSTSSTCGTRARCSPRCSRTSISSGSGADVLPHEPARPSRLHATRTPRSCRASASAARRSRRRSASAPRRSGISTVRSYGSTEHPSITGCQHDDPAREANEHRRPPVAGRRDRAARRRRHAGRAGRARRDLEQGPRLLRRLHRPGAHRRSAFDADGWFAHRRRRRARRRRLPHDRRPQEGHHHPRRREHQRARGRGAARCACRASPRSRSSRRPTSGSASTGARSSACSPAAGARPSLDEVRAHLEAAGLARQKWPEEVRGDRRVPAHPVGEDPEVRAPRAAYAPSRRSRRLAARYVRRRAGARGSPAGARATPDAPAPQDHASSANVERALDVLLDEHDRDALCPARAPKRVEHEVDELRRETERHLVGDEQPRRRGEHPGQAEHLLLAARQRAGLLAAAFAEHGEQSRARARAPRRARPAAPRTGAGRAGCRCTDRCGKIARSSGTYATPRRLICGAARPVTSVTGEPHASRRPAHPPGDRGRERALPRAVRAEHREHAALGDLEARRRTARGPRRT